MGLRLCLILVLIQWMYSYVYCLEVLEPTTIAGHYETPKLQELHLTEEDYNVSAWLILADPLHACSDVTNAHDFRDKIVLTHHGGKCSPQDKLRFVQQNGGKGMIFVRTGGYVNVGIPCLWRDGSDLSDIVIPMVCAWPTDGELLLTTIQDGNPVFVQLTYDLNQWYEFTRSTAWTFFQVFFSLWFGCISSLAGYRFIRFVRLAGGLQFSIPQTCLALEMISNLLRLSYFALDPQHSRGILTYQANNVLFTLSMPFSITAFLFLTFYWHEISSESFFSPTLEKLKIPFAITSLVLLVVEVTSNSLRSAYYSNGIALSLNGYLYILILLGLSIFYIVSGTRLLHALHTKAFSSSSPSGASTRTIARVTRILIMGCGGMWLTIIGICLLVTPMYATPWGNCLSWVLMFSGLGITSLALILAFRDKLRTPGVTSSSGSRSTQMTTFSSSTSLKSGASGDIIDA